jgi:hypothetical protein
MIGWILSLAFALIPWRSARPRDEDFRREIWRTDTRRMGVRFTERLRDRFRRTWLRLVGGD